MKDWLDWHRAYDDPASPLSFRLDQVRARLSEALDGAAPGPIHLVSLCAGQGRDVLAVLPGHPRRDDVLALLVEADSRNAVLASERATAAGLTQVRVRQADASLVANFADALPADVLLLCGIFGNVSDDDIERTVDATPALCAYGATVIWTRNRRAPDLTPRLRAWFARNGFEEVAFDTPESVALTAVGVHRLRSRPALARGHPGESGQPGCPGYPAHPLFTFGSDRA